jgi:putative peptidoglycan lipid II flippase
VRIAFGAKTFPWEATLLTGKVVALLALSVFAQAAIQLLVRSFYALEDTATPLKVSFISVIINVILSFWLVFGLHLDILGLSIAITVASILQAVILFIFLDKKVQGFLKEQYLLPIGKMLLASFLTGIALWLPMRFLDEYLLDTTRTVQLVMLTIVAGVCGLSVYLFFSKLLGISEIDKLWQVAQRFGKWRSVLAESEEVLDVAAVPQATEISDE